MKNTESATYFINYVRILDLLSEEDKLFNGAYEEESKASRKELLRGAKTYLIMECLRRSVKPNELEKKLLEEVPREIYWGYVKPIFYLIT